MTEESSSLRQRLAALSAADRARALVDMVQTQAAIVLGHSAPAAVDVSRALRELGFDSLGAVDMRSRLNTVTGLRLPVTLVFDHPTVRAVAEHVEAQLFPDDSDGDVDPEQAWFRKMLDGLSIARLREAGLLETLTLLAASEQEDYSAAVISEPDRIGELDVADLIRLANDGTEFSTEL